MAPVLVVKVIAVSAPDRGGRGLPGRLGGGWDGRRDSDCGARRGWRRGRDRHDCLIGGDGRLLGGGLHGGGGGRSALLLAAQADDDGLAVPVLQLGLHGLFLTGLPGGVPAAHGDGDGVPVGQVPHVDGPLYQLAGGLLPDLAPVVVALDQIRPVGVEAHQIQHPVRAADGHLHVRVYLDAQRTVDGEIGLVIAEEHGAEAGGQAAQPHQRPDQGGASGPPLGLPEGHDLLHPLSHLIVEVRRLEETSLLVQHHGIGRMDLHDQIAHHRVPPFPGPIRHRWPRITS